MYATCLYCHVRLGANAVVETFPVGRRLAFDATKGRLWVVCGRCGRWNLSPLEERWEAIETCERLYRDTRKRVSTDEIGLAQLHEGLELVRIGRPLRPEFAAWRYGAEFARRRVRDLARAAGITVAVLGGPPAGAAAAGVAAGATGAAVAAILGVGLAIGGSIALTQRGLRRVVARLPAHRVRTATATALAPAAHTATVREQDLRTLLVLPHADGMRVRVTSSLGWVEMEGEHATRVTALACARRNRTGAGRSAVANAVRLVETAGGPDAMLRASAAQAVALRRFHYVQRLALEMALHEEGERRALEGELRLLYDAWQHAEEIAAIADDLLLPPRVQALLRRHRTP